jgi:hypothetical protein
VIVRMCSSSVRPYGRFAQDARWAPAKAGTGQHSSERGVRSSCDGARSPRLPGEVHGTGSAATPPAGWVARWKRPQPGSIDTVGLPRRRHALVRHVHERIGGTGGRVALHRRLVAGRSRVVAHVVSVSLRAGRVHAVASPSRRRPLPIALVCVVAPAGSTRLDVCPIYGVGSGWTNNGPRSPYQPTIRVGRLDQATTARRNPRSRPAFSSMTMGKMRETRYLFPQSLGKSQPREP